MNRQEDALEIARFEQGSPVKRISRLHRLNSNSLTKSLAELGIARGTLAFLMETLSHEGIIQEDLSRALSIDRAATARALQHMEKGGFVTRTENPENRRQKCVSATEKSRAIQNSLLELLKKQKEKLFTGFTPQEQTDFLSMLDRMIRNMSTL